VIASIFCPASWTAIDLPLETIFNSESGHSTSDSFCFSDTNAADLFRRDAAFAQLLQRPQRDQVGK
jgi:hypothetical protein